MSAFARLSVAWSRFQNASRHFLMIPDREPSDYPFAPSDVAQLHRLCSDPDAASIDDASWKDLMLDVYSERLSREVSIFGRQVLHQRLRVGRGDADPGAVEALMRDPTRLAQLHRSCKPLRHSEVEIATLLHEDTPPVVPWWAGKAWLLAPALLASLLAFAISPLALVPAALVLYVLMAGQIVYHEQVETWNRKMKTLQMMLRVVTLLGGEDALPASRLNRALSRLPAAELVPGARGYADWFMLANVSHYFKGTRLVAARLDFLRACFTRISHLEADIALARHLLHTPVFCRSGASDGTVELTGAVHPMVDAAQALTIGLRGRGAFISGQNGIGKSTLLRTVGLNLVAARAFGFCYAERACVPDLPVYASMQGEDSLLGAESLYMAELRRAKELLAAADGPHPGIYIIDEIFRGTNHLESVSAAASVLDALAQKGLVIVSSHNLVLAPLLAHRLDPLCVARASDGKLALSSGVLAQTNGIALLAQQGFGERIEHNAGKVSEWLSAYLAHPDGSCKVLA